MHQHQRAHARAAIDAALNAAEPGAALRRAWPADLTGPCKLLAFGKASVPMAAEAARKLGSDLAAGLVVTAPELVRDPRLSGLSLGVHAADHPLPTPINLAAAHAVERFAHSCAPDETLLVLISGGGSAHLTLPAEGVSLDDLARVTDLLQRAGATINELNTVRKHCERLKGGRLAAMCPAARIVSLVLSDVMGDPLDVIASGPASPDPTTYAGALNVLHRRGLTAAAPRVRAWLERGAAGLEPETPKPGDAAFAKCSSKIIANNDTAVDAAAAELVKLGYGVEEIRRRVEGEARDAGFGLAARAIAARRSGSRGPVALLLGGEPTVRVDVASGIGGPSQELALAAAREIDAVAGITIAAFSTDGRDGPTDAAGAIVDAATAGRVRARRLDAAAALRDHDSHAALDAAGDLVRTGPTGTNVNHIAMALVDPGGQARNAR